MIKFFITENRGIKIMFNVKRPMTIAVMAASLLITGSVLAMHHEAQEREEQAPHMEHMIQMLDLNAEQTEAFKAMHKDRDERKQDKMARQDLRQQLHELAMQDKLDEASINKIADEIANEARTKVVMRSKAFHEFFGSLNDEQKQKFNDMHSAMKERMNERFENREKHENKHADHKMMHH
jgi:Spy/CpxP family protein refolding chaperone